MQSSSCHLTQDSSRLGLGTLWKRSNDAISLYQRPYEVQVPLQSEPRPAGNAETQNGLEASPELTKAWKTAALTKLGSLLRSAKKQGTGVREILINLWNWIVKHAKRVWQAPGREKWREAEIEKLASRAKELEAKITAARLGAMGGANVQGTELALIPAVNGFPGWEVHVTTDFAGSVPKAHEQELELAERLDMGQGLEHQQNTAPVHLRKAGVNSDSALPGTPNSPQRQSHESAGLGAAKAMFRPYQGGHMQVGVRRPPAARKAPVKLDNMLHRVPKAPTPEGPTPSKGDETGNTDPETTVKSIRRPKTQAVPAPLPLKRGGEGDGPGGPGVATAMVVGFASDAEIPAERAIITEYPEPLDDEATMAAPTPTVGTVEDANVSESMSGGFLTEGVTQDQLWEYSDMSKVISLGAALANGADLVFSPQGLTDARGELVGQVQKRGRREKLRKQVAEFGGLEAGLITHDAAVPLPEAPPVDVPEAVSSRVAVTPIAPPSVSAKLTGWLGLAKVSPVPSSTSTRRRLVHNTLEGEALDRGAWSQDQGYYLKHHVHKGAVPSAHVLEGVAADLNSLASPNANIGVMSQEQGLNGAAKGEADIARREEVAVRRPSRQGGTRHWQDTGHQTTSNHHGLMLPSSARPPEDTGFSLATILGWLMGTKPRYYVNPFPETLDHHLNRDLTNEWTEEVSMRGLRESQESPGKACENPWGRDSSEYGSERGENHLGLTDYFMRDTDEGLGWGHSTMETLEGILARTDCNWQ